MRFWGIVNEIAMTSLTSSKQLNMVNACLFALVIKISKINDTASMDFLRHSYKDLQRVALLAKGKVSCIPIIQIKLCCTLLSRLPLHNFLSCDSHTLDVSMSVRHCSLPAMNCNAHHQP